MNPPAPSQTLIAHPARGQLVAPARPLRPPGDKSLSHRALIFSALANGMSEVTGLLESQDVLATATALKALGVRLEQDQERKVWRVYGRGLGGWQTPPAPLNLGNSGTGARLLLGALAGNPLTAEMTGDASLSARPFLRVLEPLAEMGAAWQAANGKQDGKLPIRITGRSRLAPVRWRLPVASAQIKGAILLAGLAAAGRVEIEEPTPCRDHSERLLPLYGAQLGVEPLDDKKDDEAGGKLIWLDGEHDLTPANLTIAGDPSTAAFLVVAHLLCGAGTLVLENVGVNRLRAGLFDTLLEMGADLEIQPQTANQTHGGEPVATLKVRPSALKGVVVPSTRAAAMIDEYPILSVAAACAAGKTHMQGLAELRHKESDRLSAIATGLKTAGVKVASAGDDLIVTGTGAPPAGGGTINSDRDHRIAMAFLVLGLACVAPLKVIGTEWIATSFPEFRPMLQSLGARFEEVPA